MKVLAALKKEWLIVARDKGGLAVLFLMPAAMVVIMALVQDAPFKDHQAQVIDVLVLDLDKGARASQLLLGLDSTGAFRTVLAKDSSEAKFRERILAGEQRLGLVLEQAFSEKLEHAVHVQVAGMLAALQNDSNPNTSYERPNVHLVMDPTTKPAYRSSMEMALGQVLAEMEGAMMLDHLTEEISGLAEGSEPIRPDKEGIVRLKGSVAGSDGHGPDVASNSTQHNVPAWTIFAMFFIVIPLAGNVLRERNSGTTMRLRTMRAPLWVHHTGKLLAYTSIGLLQTLLILIIGIGVMPLLGLERLDLGSGLLSIASAAVAIAVAATAFGLLVSSAFKTDQQAITFGVVSVVIMAAMGGIWVPLDVMPEGMRSVGSLSPMHWAMECFNDVFLRNESASEVWQNSLPLWGFAIVSYAVALTLEHRRGD